MHTAVNLPLTQDELDRILAGEVVQMEIPDADDPDEAMLTAIAGLEQPATLTNSAAYLAHWIGELKGDNKLIVKTAGAAHRAVDHILGTFDGAE